MEMVFEYLTWELGYLCNNWDDDTFKVWEEF